MFMSSRSRLFLGHARPSAQLAAAEVLASSDRGLEDRLAPEYCEIVDAQVETSRDMERKRGGADPPMSQPLYIVDVSK